MRSVNIELLARKLFDVGFNMNLAPVVDVNKNAGNPVIGSQGRSFSRDPLVVEQFAKIFMTEHHALDILTTLKHFPGHGSSSIDTHLAVADVASSWSLEELVPYRDLVAAGIVDAIMVGHLKNELIWGGVATQQGAKAISYLLRSELKFDGPVISDDLAMGAVRLGKNSFVKVIRSAIESGVDVALISRPDEDENVNIGSYFNYSIVEAITSGGIARSSIDQSWERVISLKAKLKR